MSISRIVKLLIGALFVVTNPELAYAAISKLPKGCENYELIRGNPDTAKTFVLGEDHSYECDLAMRSCVPALLKKAGAKKSSTAFLVEYAGIDKRVSCEEEYADHFSGNCRGWNRPQKDFAAEMEVPVQYEALVEILSKVKNEYGKIFLKPSSQRKSAAIEYLDSYVKQLKKEITEYQNVVNRLDSSWYLRAHRNLKSHLYQIQYARVLRAEIADSEESETLPEVLASTALHEEVAGRIKVLEKRKQDENRMIREPNRYLLQAIKSQAKNNKHVVAVAGYDHVNNRQSGQTQQKKQMIRELYTDLDKFAHENPYAVLSCSRTRK